MVFKGAKKTEHLAGWSLQLASDGNYRAFRTVKKKNVGIHIGRTVDVEKAVEKIRAKEAELGIEPLKVTKSDLAFDQINKGKKK